MTRLKNIKVFFFYLIHIRFSSKQVFNKLIELKYVSTNEVK